ncbi:dihydrolipoyl dehydrogenase [Epilithonimonas arachidiradicis]|uniref:Dihydrolipoyl dehydrogenase n=1 Tax=Epilithonimonas arachidiradicis TaxID=1617282 RepID=A0A420D8P8_9FLAO|nr:dihydrolipoyl dehydrogenase [Epilithonimonas arachidiradicis]RKE87151.1 dihydrolipoamide dehydrogenase [Epilithonimonas arachidiradicis]GGG58633.1 dihydrolipoyl dehydrogenase [Epilithonimonas arachidiradicis]
METFDITVIGSGPGGYVAAIRSAQLGYKTAIIEKYNTLGGTCTNVGCIPTKALLDSTHHYSDALNSFGAHGIEYSDLRLNVEQLFKRKSEVVTKNTQGLDFLMRKNKITVFHGSGSFVNNETLKIVHDDQTETVINSDKFIIATGSKPSTIPGITIDKKRIITSTEALELQEKPESIVIIGGGVIGVEMASIFNRIGTKVTILEYADNLIATMDSELGKALTKILTKEGVEIKLQQAVYKAENLGNTAKVYFKNKKGEEQDLTADYILVAVGRKPYVTGLGLENTNVELNNNGTVKVNELLQTTAPNIYAIGDVVGGAMLAHKAEEEAVFVVERINGQKPHINYDRIPSVVYTWPEVASVGATEEQLKKQGVEYNIGKFPFAVNARARAGMETEGFVKVLSDPKYGELLGVHIIGARAADLIAQAVVGLEYEVTANDMATMSYAHPTYSEVMKEAYTIASGKPSLNI